jgi:hypothetical protein
MPQIDSLDGAIFTINVDGWREQQWGQQQAEPASRSADFGFGDHPVVVVQQQLHLLGCTD